MNKVHILFICTPNVYRSKAAELFFASVHDEETRVLGVEPSMIRAGHPVSQQLINWADKIFVMSEINDGHLSHLKEYFMFSEKPLYGLEIPESYKEDTPEQSRALLSELNTKFGAYSTPLSV